MRSRTFLSLSALVTLLVAGLPGGTAEAAGAAGATVRTARTAPATFTHPGVLVSRPQLDFVRARVQANAQPWKSAYDQMNASRYASLDRTPRPRAIVECGSYSNPNNGCTDEREDALAAYTLALRWYISRDSRYAEKAISIMDAWSATIQDHTNSNAPLQSGWAGSVWPRAAEIIRYTYTGWPNAGRFATMLRNVYLPEVAGGSSSNGNWELTMTEAALGIAVFLEDRAAYDRAVAKFRARLPAYVYLSADGSLPVAPPAGGVDTPAEIIRFWHDQTTFVDGLSQETCRDLTHTGYGLSSISHIAEISRIQGQDLYPEVAERLRHALGFHSKYQLGTAVPSWLCGGSLTLGLGPVTEVGFNGLHTRMGIAMTNTQTLTERQRPAGTNNLFVAWETLTHANNPN
ncbi:alginate lyase family protein [Nonomuraea rubra]